MKLSNSLMEYSTKVFLSFCLLLLLLICPSHNALASTPQEVYDIPVQSYSIPGYPLEGKTVQSYEGLVFINGEVRKIKFQDIDGVAVYQGDVVVGKTVDVLRQSEDFERGAEAAIVDSRWSQTLYWDFDANPAPRNIQNAFASLGRHGFTIRQQQTPSWTCNRVGGSSGGGSGGSPIPSYDCLGEPLIQVISEPGNTCSAYTDGLGSPGGFIRNTSDPNVTPLRRELHINPNCSQSTANHELGHVLGLAHEHARSDRDSSIRVNFNNIRPDWRDQWSSDAEAANIGNFDFNSIMLYSSFLASPPAINTNQAVMTRLNGTPWTASKDASPTADFSTQDQTALRQKYPFWR